MQRSLRADFAQPAGPGWIKAVTVHTGSRRGKGDKFARLAGRTGALLPLNGFKILYYGDGDIGNMGAFARNAIAHGAELHGIGLNFFHALHQGTGPAGKASTSVEATMETRMPAMRVSSQAAIVLPGGFGTMEEALEWLASRSAIVKPQIFINLGGFFDGLKAYVDAHPDQFGSRRAWFVATEEDAIARLHELNSLPAIAEPDVHPLPHSWSSNIIETAHAMILTAGVSVTTMSRVFSRLVSYDLSNIPGQNLFPRDGIIRPVIFIMEDGRYSGLQQQLMAIFDNEFSSPERRSLFHFAGSAEEARRIAAALDSGPPFLPAHLHTKHAEGGPAPSP